MNDLELELERFFHPNNINRRDIFEIWEERQELRLFIDAYIEYIKSSMIILLFDEKDAINFDKKNEVDTPHFNDNYELEDWKIEKICILLEGIEYENFYDLILNIVVELMGDEINTEQKRVIENVKHILNIVE